MSLADANSDAELDTYLQQDQEFGSPKANGRVAGRAGNLAGSRNQLSDSQMWKEQVHTMLKDEDTESDISDSEHFLTKGAFLLTPSHELTMEKASAICEKMTFKGCFSLTKTATGILFKFSDPDDYQIVFKKGFHKVTGSRFYKKIPIPCRPQKTFTIFVFDIPDDLPEEDVRHSLYKFTSVVEVIRLQMSGSSPGNQPSSASKAADGTSTPKQAVDKPPKAAANQPDGEPASSMQPKETTTVIRITLASIEECNILLQNGLDFYGATFFPTELAMAPLSAKLAKPSKFHFSASKQWPVLWNHIRRERVTGGTVSARVRDLLPVFDSAGFAKFSPPTSKTIKPAPVGRK